MKIHQLLTTLNQIKTDFGSSVFAPGNEGQLVAVLKDMLGANYDYCEIPFGIFCVIMGAAASRDAFRAFESVEQHRAVDVHRELVIKLYVEQGIDRAASAAVLGLIANLAGKDGLFEALWQREQGVIREKLKIGDGLAFGGIDWRVLRIGNFGRSALICSIDILEMRPYCSDLRDISWRTSLARKYLNSSFYRSFSKRDRERVIRTSIYNPDNPLYGTPGHPSTKDRIFLLDIDEARLLFSDQKDRIAYHKGQPTWWWLRSVGATNRGTMGISSDGSFDSYNSLAAGRVSRGIRPALWLEV